MLRLLLLILLLTISRPSTDDGTRWAHQFPAEPRELAPADLTGCCITAETVLLLDDQPLSLDDFREGKAAGAEIVRIVADTQKKLILRLELRKAK